MVIMVAEGSLDGGASGGGHVNRQAYCGRLLEGIASGSRHHLAGAALS